MHRMIILFLFTSLHAVAMPRLWNSDIKIDDPTLDANTVANQCYKSQMYAQDQTVAWCTKAYKMGNWQCLIPLSRKTGDTTLLFKEIHSRIEKREPDAYSTLAHLYADGDFVEQNTTKAIELYHELLSLDNDIPEALIYHVHVRLSELYEREENWVNVIHHAQIVIEESPISNHAFYVERRLKEAKERVQQE